MTFTPRAGSRILVAALVVDSNSGATIGISDTAGRTWTLESSHISPPTSEHLLLWSAPAGPSPIGTTVTLTPSVGTAYFGAGVVDVDSALTVRSASKVQSSGTPTSTGTLPTATTSGNTVLAFFGQVHPSPFYDVPLPSGFTQVIASTGSSSNIVPINWSYSTAFAGASTSTTNPSSSTVSGGALVELYTPGGAGSFQGWGFIPI